MERGSAASPFYVYLQLARVLDVSPGRLLGEEPALLEASEGVRLIASDVENLRLHYGLTLRHWLDRATAQRAAIEAMYDARFFRMWEFYLAGGIVMFESGAACNYQVQYIRDRNALPITRYYMLETERKYREIAAAPAPTKKARGASRKTALESTGV